MGAECDQEVLSRLRQKSVPKVCSLSLEKMNESFVAFPFQSPYLIASDLAECVSVHSASATGTLNCPLAADTAAYLCKSGQPNV